MLNDGRSPALQYDDNTSEIGKKLGELTNLSPKQLDYIIRSYTGVIGQFLLPATTKRSGAGSALQRMTTGAFEADPAFSSQAITNFYAKLDEYQRTKTDRNIKENLPSKINTMEEKMYSRMNTIASSISKTTKYINANLKADDPKVKKLKEIVNTYAMKAVKANNLADLVRTSAEFKAALYKEGVR
jgi:DNA-directed RNA polymerase subunit F